MKYAAIVVSSFVALSSAATVRLWEDALLLGQMWEFEQLNGNCFNFHRDIPDRRGFDNIVSSLEVADGKCDFFVDNDCTGDDYPDIVGIIYRLPDYLNDAFSSMRC